MTREIIAFGDYYIEFINSLNKREQAKIKRALLLFSSVDKVPFHYVKYIRDEIYEFRVRSGNNIFRLFFIYDDNTIVVLLNCFRKKTQKTPKSEIDKAVRLKNEYYVQKNENT